MHIDTIDALLDSLESVVLEGRKVMATTDPFDVKRTKVMALFVKHGIM